MLRMTRGLREVKFTKSFPTKVITTIELECLKEDLPKLFDILEMVDCPHLDKFKAELKDILK